MKLPLIVRAALLEEVERTPVWFMRQAGRSLPEYRLIRGKYDLFEICRQPELCAEITLQPVVRHGVDAAVIYSDIMVPALGMGVGVRICEGVGPVIDQPICDARDVQKLVVAEPEEVVPYVTEAIARVRSALDPSCAVIGFAGGPFTVAGYLIEGRPSRTFTKTKRLMYDASSLWHDLMSKLSSAFALYVSGQVRAGADVIQLFDSWAGFLSIADYEEFVAPYSAQILDAVDVPTVHFATGASHLIESMTHVGGKVIRVDWRTPLDKAWLRVGYDRGIQGNLDPTVLLGPWDRVERETSAVLAAADGRPGHIFNLGHGVLPETDPGVLTDLVAFIRDC